MEIRRVDALGHNIGIIILINQQNLKIQVVVNYFEL